MSMRNMHFLDLKTRISVPPPAEWIPCEVRDSATNTTVGFVHVIALPHAGEIVMTRREPHSPVVAYQVMNVGHWTRLQEKDDPATHDFYHHGVILLVKTVPTGDAFAEKVDA